MCCSITSNYRNSAPVFTQQLVPLVYVRHEIWYAMVLYDYKVFYAVLTSIYEISMYLYRVKMSIQCISYQYVFILSQNVQHSSSSSLISNTGHRPTIQHVYRQT